MKIVIISENKFQDYELELLAKRAKTLSKARFLTVEETHGAKGIDTADVVVLFNMSRGFFYQDIKISIKMIFLGSQLAIKGLEVFLITCNGKKPGYGPLDYHIWRVYKNAIEDRTVTGEQKYLFKKYSKVPWEVKGEDNRWTFNHFDWSKFQQEFILKKDKLS